MVQPGAAMPLTAPELRAIGAMPLHEVTARYGEKGLRARLAAEARRLPGDDPAAAVARALSLAARLHQEDRRQSEPYLNHLLRVALRIIVHYEIRDLDIARAALLHDSVEDHAGDLSPGGRDGALAVLAARFGPRVTDLVGAVTNPAWDPAGDKRAQYREHVTGLLRDGDPQAGIIKLADFTDNGIGINYTTGDKAASLARKYAPLVPVFEEFAARPGTPLPAAARARVLRQLRSATARFTAICGAPRSAPP